MENKSNESHVLPAVFLFLFLASAYLWAARHLGLGGGRPSWLVAPLGAFGFAWGSVALLFPKKEKETFKARLGRTLREVLLRPSVVQVLWGVLLLLVLLFSSVTIVAEPGVELTKAGVARLSGGDEKFHSVDTAVGQMRVPVLASPVVGAHVVKVEGYLPTVVEARPLLGARIRLGHDVQRSPSILFRPVGSVKDALSGVARLSVYRKNGEKWDKITESDAGQVGSFLLGRGHFDFRNRLGDWERELIVAGAAEGAQLNQHLLDWLTVHRLPLERDLMPGDTLLVRVVAGEDRQFAAEEIVLEAVGLLDVLVQPDI